MREKKKWNVKISEISIKNENTMNYIVKLEIDIFIDKTGLLGNFLVENKK